MKYGWQLASILSGENTPSHSSTSSVLSMPTSSKSQAMLMRRLRKVDADCSLSGSPSEIELLGAKNQLRSAVQVDIARVGAND